MRLLINAIAGALVLSSVSCTSFNPLLHPAFLAALEEARAAEQPQQAQHQTRDQNANQEPETPELPGVVTAVEGTVQIRRSREQPWILAGLGARFGAGTEIRTGEGSSAVLVFEGNDSKILVNANSQLLFESVAADNGKVDVVVLVISGEVTGTFTSGESMSSFKIVPPDGIAMEYRPRPGQRMQFSLAVQFPGLPGGGVGAGQLTAFSDPLGAGPRGAIGDPANVFKGVPPADPRVIPEPTPLGLTLLSVAFGGLALMLARRR